jgi:class 3 adenylate cyclase
VTVLFADLKGSMELLADRDPEEARKILDPVLAHMMDAVHRYEGTVNQVMGDGIMALFGAPIAHEDHAVRACYAALRMQESVNRYAEDARRAHGVTVQIRVGLNSGEVVVRAIGNDLHMNYTAIGETTHLAACMEQAASPGTALIAPATPPACSSARSSSVGSGTSRVTLRSQWPLWGTCTRGRDALRRASPACSWRWPTLNAQGLASVRRDGTLQNPVTIWVVRVGDDVYVRSWKGRTGSWFRASQARHEGHIKAGGIDKDVTFVMATDDDINDPIDAAYRTKYRRYGGRYVNPMVAPEARAATIKLVPRSTSS